MSKSLSWVIGQGGLLGSHLVRRLREPAAQSKYELWPGPIDALRWTDVRILPDQLQGAVAALTDAVRRGGYDHWTLIWTAGCGVIGSSPDALERETATWRFLLDLLHRELGQPSSPWGTIFLASSAGGLHGRGADQPLTEASSPSPVSDYGRHKLQQELSLRSWAEQHPHVGYVIGRIANLYGPGQNLSKPQGLISHLSRCLIWHRPVCVYVPLDTIRDYIYADDCADLILQCLALARAIGPRCRTVKMLASGEAQSVARVIGAFTQLARRQPQITCSPSARSSLQARKLQFRSTVWPDLRPSRPTPLVLGVRHVHEHQLSLFARGLLPAVPI
jgi:UDP-glucose 4-epimerase